jgi:hypothetical protein
LYSCCFFLIYFRFLVGFVVIIPSTRCVLLAKICLQFFQERSRCFAFLVISIVIFHCLVLLA